MHKAAAASSMNTHDRVVFRNRVMTEAAEECLCYSIMIQMVLLAQMESSTIACIVHMPEGQSI